MTPPATFGILADTYILYLDRASMTHVRRPVDIRALRHVGEVIDLALACNLDRIWVHTSEAGYEAISDSFIADANTAGYKVFPTDFEKNSYFFAWRKNAAGQKVEIGVGFFDHEWSKWKPPIKEGEGSSFDISVKDVYTMYRYLEQALGVPVQRSAGRIGQELIKQTNDGGKRAGYLQAPTQDMQMFRMVTGASTAWHRPLTKAERGKQWLHHVDRNAAYLNSCSIQLGYGDYEVIQHPQFTPTVPGLWHVTIAGSSLYEGEHMPCITPLLMSPQRTDWVYTSTVKLLLDVGYDLTVHAGMLWPVRRANILGPWQKLISAAYVGLRSDAHTYPNQAARELAYKAFKGVYTQGLSHLSHDENTTYKNYINRPDWYHMVTADMSQRMLRTMMRFHESGIDAVACLTDGLYFPSDEEDITQALPGLLMNGHVGHFKHVYSVPLSDVADLFERNVNTAQVITELKKKVRGYQYA